MDSTPGGVSMGMNAHQGAGIRAMSEETRLTLILVTGHTEGGQNSWEGMEAIRFTSSAILEGDPWLT